MKRATLQQFNAFVGLNAFESRAFHSHSDNARYFVREHYNVEGKLIAVAAYKRRDAVYFIETNIGAN